MYIEKTWAKNILTQYVSEFITSLKYWDCEPKKGKEGM